ncbi:hypothetical protein ACB092_10G090500 [Castanea dentata]
METLVVVAQHRNHHHHHQYYSRSSNGKAHGSGRFGFRFGSSVPSRGINCRSYQSGAGILPTPFKAFYTPVTKHTCSPSSPPSQSYSSSDCNTTHPSAKSAPIDIVRNGCEKEAAFIGDESTNGCSCECECGSEGLSFCELWAGPTYSNSPPPSSLPIPKFSLMPKRTVSLDLPSGSDLVADNNHHPIAKSAPPSPTREHSNCTRDMFATKTLRRILNLDVDDDE